MLTTPVVPIVVGDIVLALPEIPGGHVYSCSRGAGDGGNVGCVWVWFTHGL